MRKSISALLCLCILFAVLGGCDSNNRINNNQGSNQNNSQKNSPLGTADSAKGSTNGSKDSTNNVSNNTNPNSNADKSTKYDNLTELNGTIRVVTTIFAPYDFVRQIAGGKAEVMMLLPPGSESHSYEPTPKDIITIQNCDIFIYIGGESDSWVNEVLGSMDTGKMRTVTLMDCVDVVKEEIVEGMESDHSHDEDDAHNAGHSDSHDHDDAQGGEYSDNLDQHDAHSGEYSDSHSQDDVHDRDNEEAIHNHDESHTGNHTREYDEHVWTSPKNAKLIVQRISDTLCEADAVNADSYKEATAVYLAQLNDLDSRFREIVDSASRRTLVFGDRFPFRYFADAYGLEYFAAFPGCSSETEASAATVVFLINKIKTEAIPVVFHLELSNQKMANTISEETDARVLLFHACHNVTKDEMSKGVTYIELMYQNAENLREALQ